MHGGGKIIKKTGKLPINTLFSFPSRALLPSTMKIANNYILLQCMDFSEHSLRRRAVVAGRFYRPVCAVDVFIVN